MNLRKDHQIICDRLASFVRDSADVTSAVGGGGGIYGLQIIRALFRRPMLQG